MSTAYTSEVHSAFFRRTLTRLRQTSPGLVDRLDLLLSEPLDGARLDQLWKWVVEDAGGAAGVAANTVVATPAATASAATGSMELNLRRFRAMAMLALIERDLGREAPLSEVLRAITALAEKSISHALRRAANACDERGLPNDEATRAEAIERLKDADGDAQDLMVVGMGKLGGGELNVSSDVDLVFCCRDQGARPEHIERVIRQTCSLLSTPTADGYVFRVDTRLRPYGDAGPPFSSFNMLEQYFYEQGREWERFAWLKGRVIASTGLVPAQTVKDESDLMQVVTPFVYRRYLDYDAFASLAKLHDMIGAEQRRHSARRARSQNAGFDVKLGRGGIREIEFCAQLFQLVRGGQDPTLRIRPTPPALERLADKRVIAPEEARTLTESWEFLRRIEHALQYQEDEQTHWLPDAPEKRAAIADMLRIGHAEFDARVQQTREGVMAIFDRVLAPTRRDSKPVRPEDLESELDEDSVRRIGALRESRRYRLASNEVRERIERLLHRALTDAVPDEDADDTEPGSGQDGARRPPQWVGPLCDFLENTAGRPAYLTLLDDYPKAFEQLVLILSRAKWAASYLLKHPIVLDELLDGQMLEDFDSARWAAELREQLKATVLPAAPGSGEPPRPDVERRMDAVRAAHHAATFRLLAQDLDGRISVEALGDRLSELADQTLAIAIDEAWGQLPRRHRDRPRFAAIAYGKLGGLELGYSSDLDLVFLFDDDHDDAPQIYAMLAQRVAAWLSTRTAAGQLFEIDLRLRPNGNAGLLVSSLRAFSLYQRESAWVWEHQALTRARFSAGDEQIGKAFEDLRREILARPRDIPVLASEILSMRRKMHEGHPNRSGLFDVKHETGGMVDIEFIVQFLVLAHGHEHPELRDNRGNIELLRRAGAAGLIDAELASRAGNIYRRYRQIQHTMRLNEASYARVARSVVVDEETAVRQLWRAVFQAYEGVAAPKKPAGRTGLPPMDG